MFITLDKYHVIVSTEKLFYCRAYQLANSKSWALEVCYETPTGYMEKVLYLSQDKCKVIDAYEILNNKINEQQKSLLS